MIAVAEIAGAFLITQAGFMIRLLGSTARTAAQWGFAFLAAVVLLLGWQAGKLIARPRHPATAAPATSAAAAPAAATPAATSDAHRSGKLTVIPESGNADAPS